MRASAFAHLSSLAAAILSLAACDGAGGIQSPGSPAMVVVGGQNQRDTVLVQLPELIDVVAGHRSHKRSAIVLTGPSFSTAGSDTLVQNLTPIKGAIVNFVVPNAGCGRPFAGSALTDSLGHAKERWVLGTKAGPCVMEARLVDQTTGAALVVDSIHATVLPGAVRVLHFTAGLRGASMQQPYGGFRLGDTVPLAPMIGSAVDIHGNDARGGAVMWTVQDSAMRPDAPTWTWRSDPAVFDSAGLWRLYVRADSAVQFTWIRIAAP